PSSMSSNSVAVFLLICMACSIWLSAAWMRFARIKDLSRACFVLEEVLISALDGPAGCNRHVRFTPESGHVQCTSSCVLWANSRHRARSACALFDDFISAAEHRRRECEAYCLGGLKID